MKRPPGQVMRTVPVRTVDEQAAAMIVKHREMLVGQRTRAINALRGHAAEFGIVAAKRCGNVAALVPYQRSGNTAQLS